MKLVISYSFTLSNVTADNLQVIAAGLSVGFFHLSFNQIDFNNRHSYLEDVWLVDIIRITIQQ